MAGVDQLPADQRAVLQLVLQRGRSYDEIAQLLSIDRAGVRDRALRALDELGPRTDVSDENRALIVDYLLGQLPPRVAGLARERLAKSAGERAWARVLASELAPLAASPLPEIPAPGDARRRDAAPAAAPAHDLAPAAEARAERRPRPMSDPGGGPPAQDAPARPVSRRGGALLLGVAGIAALVIVILAAGGGSSHHAGSTTAATNPAPATSTATSASTTARPVAQINLVPPSSSGKAAGVAQVIRQGNKVGLVIVAQGVAPNTTSNAYAIWLFNSASDSRLLGFVNPSVGSNGKLETTGILPTDVRHFKQLLVTLETQGRPRGPGKIVLEGQITGF